MPILIPTEGAEESPSVETHYAALSSIDISNVRHGHSFESVDIEALTSSHALESMDIAGDRLRLSSESIDVGNFRVDDVFRSLDVVNGDSFIILADILSEELSGENLGSFAFTEITAELLVNSVVVPIKSFQFSVPSGKLGSTLNVVLADPDVTDIPAGASVKFQLVIRVEGVNHNYVLMDNAKLQTRDSSVKWKGGPGNGPQDEVTFGALDVIADKFGLAPRRPVIMYDPYRVTFDEVAQRPRDAIQDDQGHPILPIIEPVYGLSMSQIIARAYTNVGGTAFISHLSREFLASISWVTLIGSPGTDQVGCGFTAVVTNIPDYKVRRADFSIDGGWHDGAQPCVGMYSPLYFVEGTVLFIIDVDRLLPYGYTAHPITLGDHKSLSDRIAYKPDANAVLLTYQYANNDPNEDPARLFREVYSFTEDESNGIDYGDPGYLKKVTERWDLEYYLADFPAEVLSTIPIRIESRTQQTVNYASIVDDAIVFTSYGVRTTHREVTTYQYRGELLVHSIKITEGLITTGDSPSFTLTELARERTYINWIDDPFAPGIKIQDRNITEITGIIVTNRDTETVQGPDGPIEINRAFPVLLAQQSGIINSDSLFSERLVPIKSIHEVLHRLNDTQFNVDIVEIDYLNNTINRSYGQAVTGNNETSQYGSKTRTVLIRDLVSEADIGPRIPVPVNAYELPRIRALELARNSLMRLKNPLQQLPIDLPGVDFTLARGSIIKGQKRDASYTTNYFVTGYSINGNNLGHTGHRIAQSLECIELLG